MGCEGAMDIDLPTEVGPTEETVEALLEYLVGPLLPLKHSDIAKETLSESQRKSVAKQVHAASVLYNYYHLNHQRESQFLKFDQFCSLAIMFKPSILHHMKYMCQSDRPILNDPENQLSITEKAIMDACTVSETLLNGSADVASMIKEWPITKVAVLLIDSKKENCFLQFNDGVWSVIEKDLYPDESEIGREIKKNKKIMREYDEEGEAGFQKLAFSAVKEVTGIANGELKILESHVVYSLSRAETCTRFYIVQSNQSISEDNLVPIQDAICSLQGPVVKKTSGSWVITPVVEYYYLLPYADILSEWFSRVSGTTLKPLSKVADDDVITSRLIGSPFDQKVKQTKSSIANRITCVINDRKNQKDTNGSCKVELNNSSSGPDNNPPVCLQKENQNNKIQTPLKVYRHEKRITPKNAISKKEDVKDLKKMSTVDENKDRTLIVDHTLNDFHVIVDAKRSELSEAALRALLNKRQKLCNKQHIIEAELTLCDKKIQAIMHGGIGDCLGLKLEAVIDCCNEICEQVDLQGQDHSNMHLNQSLPLSGKSLSEAQLTLRKACQELDDICLSNNWTLPTYHTSRSDSGFVANVNVKGTNFDCSGVSGIHPTIHEARNFAATHVISKLQQMANDHINPALI